MKKKNKKKTKKKLKKTLKLEKSNDEHNKNEKATLKEKRNFLASIFIYHLRTKNILLKYHNFSHFQTIKMEIKMSRHMKKTHNFEIRKYSKLETGKTLVEKERHKECMKLLKKLYNTV